MKKSGGMLVFAGGGGGGWSSGSVSGGAGGNISTTTHYLQGGAGGGSGGGNWLTVSFFNGQLPGDGWQVITAGEYQAMVCVFPVNTVFPIGERKLGRRRRLR